MPDQPLRRMFAPKGRTPPPSGRGAAAATAPDDDPRLQGIGTSATGLVEGPWGPFQCGDPRPCWKFDAEANACDHPDVKTDPETREFLEDGRPEVDAWDCCNRFWPADVSYEQYQQGAGKGDVDERLSEQHKELGVGSLRPPKGQATEGR